MSYKVSVESVGEADADDVLIALIDSMFRQNSKKGWALFGLGLLVPLSLTVAFWLSGSFLVAAASSAAALALVICRIIGLSGERPAAQNDRPGENQALVAAKYRNAPSAPIRDSVASAIPSGRRARNEASNRTPPELAMPTRQTVSGKYP